MGPVATVNAAGRNKMFYAQYNAYSVGCVCEMQGESGRNAGRIIKK